MSSSWLLLSLNTGQNSDRLIMRFNCRLSSIRLGKLPALRAPALHYCDRLDVSPLFAPIHDRGAPRKKQKTLR
jgi:hypothetical protein